ncbi:MAG: SUMF1/EgtB/PvdO family nonheme iron enzyme [Desulfovibrionaceae bacterium]|nr:SUMF1/EgtB/PvdO family nonheme iron enzyme [Desulfovibrionaceae bacterium]
MESGTAAVRRIGRHQFRHPSFGRFKQFLARAGLTLACSSLLLGAAPDPGLALPFLNGGSSAAACNPQPDKQAERDIAMPMPGGLSMVFRVVAVPARGYLWPLEATLGAADEPESGRAVYDTRYRALISAPFSGDDVPAQWKQSLPADADGQFFYYLIAKYEVTRAQFAAVMDQANAASAADTQGGDLPVTGISWYEAMLFTERYTEWLLANHPGILPTFKDDTRNTGYVRLPTEAEWEYAARGGQNESTNYRQQPFFSMAEDSALSDYAIYKDGQGKAALSPVGSRKPNPLGLYDTAGNAAEMTLDAFRFSVSGSLQGAAGGFVRKGGSYLSNEEGIMPGRRDEVPLFRKDGPAKADDLGFRPVISGINTPGGGRLSELQAEYDRISGQRTSAGAMGEKGAATPMEELNRLIDRSTDAVMRAHLLSLRAELGKSNILQAQDRAARAENSIQQCAMTLEMARNIEYKSYILREIELVGITAAVQEAQGGKKQRWQKLKTAKEKELAANDRLLNETLAMYIGDVQEIGTMDSGDVTAGFQNLAALYRGEDRFNYRMGLILAMVRSHYTKVADGGILEARALLDELVNSK